MSVGLPVVLRRRTGGRLMPNYDFRCSGDCGRTVEVSLSMSEINTDNTCPTCGSFRITCPTCGAPMDRIFTPPAISFKGAGFYSTDNRAG